jgi:trehalose utilization protein
MADPIRVTVWGENIHEHRDPQVKEIYPDTMHETIAAGIRSQLGDAVNVRTAWLQQPEHGLTEEVLAQTDVLTWWGHAGHDDVSDEVATRVQQTVQSGMGMLALHSAHFSKAFIRLMGTTCSLDWRSDHDRELIWTVAAGHPIAAGIPHPLVLDREEMYGEHFDVPQPDELVFLSSFTGGEVFRSGCCYRRGRGRVFYFRPGDQDFPTYHNPHIQRVVANAVRWLTPTEPRALPTVHHRPRPNWFT